MAEINWDVSKKLPEMILLGMVRLEQAAEIIRAEAKTILQSKINPKHPPYPVNRPPSGGKYWTERKAGSMVKTIRVVRKPGVRNIWVMAGNSKTWWAIQMEYGHGDWKGGSRSFLRPALKKSIPKIKAMIENG